jgi:Protein of unknown function (DUF2281)
MTRATEKRLLALLQRLPPEQVQHLLEYAEFLLERHGLPEETPEAVEIPRPPEETVIQAIKRLSATYPMLDRRVLFNETSVLMTQHVLSGRDAVEIIDELQSLFRRHYETLIEGRKDDDPR